MIANKNKCYHVVCLDKPHNGYYFVKSTALQAMQALIYFLNLSHNDPNAVVNMYGGGRTLSVTHNGLTYSCIND